MTALVTYMSYIILALVGYCRDILMRLGIDKDKAAQESPKLKVRFSKKVTLLVKKITEGIY